MPLKYVQIAASLRANIQSGAYQNTMRLPTENELARTYGVNRQTVRRALALLTGEGLIERRKGSGSYLKNAAERGNSVAILTTSINDYIFPAILQDAQAVFEKYGCSTMLFCTHNEVNREREILKSILGGPVCGLLAEGTKTALPNPNLDLYRRLGEIGVPVVFLHGCYAALPGSVCVSDDNFGGGRLLTDYLLKKGHTKIAGIFKSDDIQGHDRYAGFLSAFRDAGLPLPDSRVAWFTTEEKKRFLHGGPAETADLVGQTVEGCTAAVCYNDEVAFALIAMLQGKGVRVPEDFAVVSFDNSSYSEFCSVRITSLAHGSRHIGRIAAERLVSLLQGKQASSEVVPWTLVEKESG